MVPLLLFVEGRINFAGGGAADQYVDLVKEALSLLQAHPDPGRAATLNAALSHAYGWAGLLHDALAANSAALSGVAKVGLFDQQFLGWSVEHWTLSLRGRILARLGLYTEARQCLDSILAIEHRRVDPTVQFIAHVGYLDIAWLLDDPQLAAMHASQVAAIAEAHPSAYLRVFSFACLGAAQSIGGDFEQAIREYRKALLLIRDSKAALEYEPEVLASLAECHDRLADHQGAIVMAEEAIALARARAARLSECRASITLGVALLNNSGSSQANETAAAGLFLRAEALIRETGAVVYEAALLRGRQRLIALETGAAVHEQ